MSDNLKSFLDMLAISELGKELIAASDNGYNVLVGSTAKHPLLFNSYAAHPHIYNKQFNSTAAGRYQIIFPTWEGLRKKFGYTNFGPAEQDAGATELIKEVGALSYVSSGQLDRAIAMCGRLWASLAGAGSGQHENSLAYLKQAYTASGGQIA